LIQEVSDTRSNPTENLAHAATVLQKSKPRRNVFNVIYSGQKYKTQEEISLKTGLSQIRVLQETAILWSNSIITRHRQDGKFIYGKDKFYNQNRKKVLALATNKNKLSRLPTKSNPKISIVVKIPIPKQKLQDVFITLDDMTSFSKSKKIKNVSPKPLGELSFKQGIQNIIGEKGKFQDWGGEKNDLLTTRMPIHGKKRRVAFAFKGKGTSGILTPKKMGTNGDQIQRLFETAADVFILQYWGSIGERVLEQMEGWAQLKSYKDEKKIFYGVINGVDSMKIITSYPKKFPSDTIKRKPKK